jgi:hypothetical protein
MLYLQRASWWLALGLVMASSFTGSSEAAAGSPVLVNANVGGRTIAGLALVREPNRCILLGSDGSLHDFDPTLGENQIKPLPGSFQPLDMATLRHQLQKEFGAEFEVQAAGRFLVVQPRGTREKWAEQFDQLHRTFTHYFSVRGVRVLEGNFPQVAVVFPDQPTFIKRMQQIQPISNRDILGLYDRASNRIYMYAQTGNSEEFAATVRHEAAHQSAFNSGVHSRFAQTPHWLVEGVGCVFQATAMAAGSRRSNPVDRVDAELLAAFRAAYAKQETLLLADLQSLIVKDVLFNDRESTRRAYLASWALTFYLSERQPQQFAGLIAHYGQLAPFSEYSEAARQKDFVRLVGPVDTQLVNQLKRFLDQF